MNRGGSRQAQKIWYRALSTYLTSSSNYAAARNAAIKAAKDLYPTDTTTCANIAASFSAIAVPAGTETCGTSGGGGTGTGTNILT